VLSDKVLGCCCTLGDGALSDQQAAELARLFSVLADPVRLRMLSMIASAPEMCSCALEEPLDKSQPTVSHHTRVLAEAGLIEGERRGRWVWWHIVPERLDEIVRILSRA
jgi:ArsR family transcriptional regulator